MVAALTEHEKEIYLTTIFQRPVSEFFADSQKPDQGRGQVVALVSSLDHTKQLLDEFAMCGDERAIHQWRSENSPTEYACGECGLGVDSIGGSTLVFSEESCRIPWSRWRASARNLPDDQLFAAMTDADAAFITHGQEGFTHSTRPKYVVSAELRVLRHELKRRGLDWFAWDKRYDRSRAAVEALRIPSRRPRQRRRRVIRVGRYLVECHRPDCQGETSGVTVP